MHFLRRRGMAAPLLLGMAGLTGALSAGCGSSSTSSTARIRGADLSVNGGTTGVLVNSTAVGGDLVYGQISAYNFVGQGVSTFSFTTTASVPTVTVTGVTTTAVVPPNPQLQLNNGSFYTAYLIGRIDVPPLNTARADPRFLQTVVTGDRGAAAAYQSTSPPSTVVTAPYADPPAGEANIRILNAAPDAGPVDVLIGGTPAFTNVAYPALPAGLGGADVPAVNPVTPYAARSAGTLSIQVNAAGTSTVLVPAASVPIVAGQVYTIAVTETATTPVYSLSVQNDQ